jgi:hypothetical protein
MAKSGAHSVRPTQLDPIDCQGLGYSLWNLMTELPQDVIFSGILEEHTEGKAHIHGIPGITFLGSPQSDMDKAC